MEKAIVAGRAPIKVNVEEGQSYWWCACGRSASQPFCDGSHEGTGFSPIEYVAEKSTTKFFCACKATKNPPFCDGTHRSLPTE
jgi:CDGSH iron-sulfur domain-containing protein 3